MTATASPTVMTPVQPGQRIHAMDVLRGLALLGIALMNVEFFNRPATEFQPELAQAGWDRIAGWLVLVFVTGKFWVLFSLLFGMGFALMLQRAKERGAQFTRLYLRRTFALMAFGLAHTVLLWTGDILYGYAVTALMLLLILYGRWWHWPLAGVAFVAAGALMGAAKEWTGYLGLLAFVALAALYVRRPEGRPGMGAALDALLLLGCGMLVGSTVAAWMGKLGPMTPLLVFGALFVLLAWLGMRHRDVVRSRLLHVGVAILLLATVGMLAAGVSRAFAPWEQRPTPEQLQAETKRTAEFEREERISEAALRSPHYLDGLRNRAHGFASIVGPGYAGFAVMALSIFLIGTWLSQRGLVTDAASHARFWRLWLWAWPACAVITILALQYAWDPGDDARLGPFLVSEAIRRGVALPMALGYMAMVLMGLQRPTVARWLSWLAPAGRMALTNYLMQSMVCAFVFYGWGLHQWGMPRHQQVLLVCVLWLCQLAISALWLRRFRIGPMEWLWRWLTYGTRPPLLRRDGEPAIAGTAAA